MALVGVVSDFSGGSARTAKIHRLRDFMMNIAA
jgi:hypothetical protein